MAFTRSSELWLATAPASAPHHGQDCAGLTCTTLLGLLASTGLRPGEALHFGAKLCAYAFLSHGIVMTSGPALPRGPGLTMAHMRAENENEPVRYSVHTTFRAVRHDGCLTTQHITPTVISHPLS